MTKRKCMSCEIEFLTRGRYRRCPRCRKKLRDRRRRLRLKKNHVERVERQVLYERDKGICQLCFEPVLYSEFHIDHIWPVARGGKHSYANTQVTHAECNRRKGSKLRRD